ncbi:hypothetical protein ACA910_008693 [Epithemia clementina (nom. ined.)]
MTKNKKLKLLHRIQAQVANVLVGILVLLPLCWQSEKAADALNVIILLDALVICDGKYFKLPADKIVPREMVKLRLGDCVLADLRMLEVLNFAIFGLILIFICCLLLLMHGNVACGGKLW